MRTEKNPHVLRQKKDILWLSLFFIQSSVSQPFLIRGILPLFFNNLAYGTPICILLVNTSQIQKLAAPLEISAAPKGSAAPRLRTTDLEKGPQRDIPLSWLTNTQRHLNTHLSIVNAGLPFTSILQIKCGSKKEKRKTNLQLKLKSKSLQLLYKRGCENEDSTIK